MISYHEYAYQILLGTTLDDKLINTAIDWSSWKCFELPKLPGRSGRLGFSDLQFKFPKKNHLKDDDKKAMALHSFANHELLAIEMMASAILIYPHHDEESIRFKRGIVTALKDEQKHLSLYISRLNELGYEFGDFPLNDFFWRQMEKLKTPSEYLAVMALTFEAANLDFAQYYSKVFAEFGDQRTSSILQTVLEDELSHVSFGAHWLKKWRQNKELWDYYRELLPWPMTPARGKGIGFDIGLHQKAMNDENFVKNLEAFNDDFMVTRRN